LSLEDIGKVVSVGFSPLQADIGGNQAQFGYHRGGSEDRGRTDRNPGAAERGEGSDLVPFAQANLVQFGSPGERINSYSPDGELPAGSILYPPNGPLLDYPGKNEGYESHDQDQEKGNCERYLLPGFHCRLRIYQMARPCRDSSGAGV